MILTSLEFSRIEGKNIHLYLIEPEFPIEFEYIPSKELKFAGAQIPKTNTPYLDQLEQILRKVTKITPATLLFMERGTSPNLDQQHIGVENLAKSIGIPFKYIDLPSDLKESQFLNLKRQWDFIQKLDTAKKSFQAKENYEIETRNLNALISSTRNSFESDVHDLMKNKRPMWIIFQIMEILRQWDSPEISCFLVISKNLHSEILKIADQLEVETEQYWVYREITELVDVTNFKNAVENKDLIQLNLKKEKIKTEKKYLLYMVDTDPIATPYDITMAYDAGYDAVIHFEDVKPSETTGLIQDLVFSRRNNKYTTLFLNGRHESVFFEVLDRVKKAMFGPFKLSVVIDPRGSCSGAASAVGLIEDLVYTRRMGKIENKNVVVFGGTGPFGHLIATLLYKDGCDVCIVETWKNRDEKFLESFLEYTKKTYNVRLTGSLAFDEESRIRLAKNADIIISTAAPGIQILNKTIMEQIPKGKLAIDTNMVAPAGIDGITVDMNGQEIYPGIFALGAMTIGGLKYKVEMKMLKDAKEAKSGFFDLYYAVKTAKRILHLPEKKKRLDERLK